MQFLHPSLGNLAKVDFNTFFTAIPGNFRVLIHLRSFMVYNYAFGVCFFFVWQVSFIFE